MKTYFKNSMIALAITFAFTTTACNNASPEQKKEAVEEHSGDHTYACPMHPEVTGKEGDTCPKCGMKLEHNDNAGGAKNVKMHFTTLPSAVSAGKEVTLSFIPKLIGNDKEPVPLDVEHEKKIHLIIVSDDLSYFDHIHPEMNTDGSYTVKHTFPSGGKYTLFADYKPSNGNHIVDKLNVDVSGTSSPSKVFSGNKLSGSSGKYAFELHPAGGRFVSGVLMHMSGIVKKDGKEIDANTLDNYLGAKGHMVVISTNEKEYLHVHPGIAEGRFDLHTTFEKPGMYRGWIQFNGDDKLHTIDFTIDVSKGDAEDVKKMNEAHTDFHTKGSK